ncbi:zinc finger protein 846-like [Limulus polyphemus]|uniref:Zinc finger protein 846-like n=1 Tax=Limulus polyphemus TaxID=6850 RepID=A0ABM1SLI9_LIMPO|nr:zinc finger protein 846-like [Limulus polyphemus]
MTGNPRVSVHCVEDCFVVLTTSNPTSVLSMVSSNRPILFVCSKNLDIETGVKVTSTCPVCGQKLATSSSLNRHLATHYPSTSKYECNLCGKHIKRKDHYNLHMRQVHGSREQLYVCPKCDKVFTTGHYLNRHLFWAHSEDDSTKSNE